MKLLFTILGFLALGIGCVGIVVPFLPTTPFLLAAAVCFAKSYERLSIWFRGTKLYKSNLESLAKKQGMTKGAKLRVMGTVTALFVIAAFFMRGTIHGLIALGVVWLAHFVAFAFIVKTKTEVNTP